MISLWHRVVFLFVHLISWIINGRRLWHRWVKHVAILKRSGTVRVMMIQSLARRYEGSKYNSPGRVFGLSDWHKFFTDCHMGWILSAFPGNIFVMTNFLWVWSEPFVHCIIPESPYLFYVVCSLERLFLDISGNPSVVSNLRSYPSPHLDLLFVASSGTWLLQSQILRPHNF